MSYYYNYYLGYQDKESKLFYPYAPFTSDGKRRPILSRSRSFASDLHEDFSMIPSDKYSDELKKVFSYLRWDGESAYDDRIKFLPVENLPKGSFIKTGYFLIKDVRAYEDIGDDYVDELSYNRLSPEVYAAKLQHEIMFGKNQPKKDDEGYEFTEPNASDYMFYAYPDYRSKEYESHLIWELVDVLRGYDSDNREYVILETEG